MKRIVILAALTSSLFAVDGYKVYQDKCKVCHVEMMSSKEALKNLHKLSAPPMIEVSNRLKEMIMLKEADEDVNRELILTFIRDYVINPNMDKSMCHLGALDRFDVMPSLKGKITEEELDAVSQWVYDHYEGKKF